MIYTISLFLPLALLVVGLVLFFRKQAATFVFLLLAAISAPLAIVPWYDHSSDLATLRHQGELIKVYEERIESLSNTLSDFQYPQGALMNQDSPVLSIVESISEAEKKLAWIKAEKAKAAISIERRRLGMMSGVIYWVGE